MSKMFCYIIRLLYICYIKANDKVYQGISKTKNRPLGETDGSKQSAVNAL